MYAHIHSEVCAGQPTFAHFGSTEALLCTSVLGLLQVCVVLAAEHTELYVINSTAYFDLEPGELYQLELWLFRQA